MMDDLALITQKKMDEIQHAKTRIDRDQFICDLLKKEVPLREIQHEYRREFQEGCGTNRIMRLKKKMKRLNLLPLITSNLQNEHPMYVYFISNGLHVKIGKSKNPKQRLNELQTSSPLFLSLIFISEKFTEAELQERFKIDHQTREWFGYSLAIKEFVRLCNQLKLNRVEGNHE